MYDIFIYTEDDIYIPNLAIDYWLKYSLSVIRDGYNLGFLRIEFDNVGNEYVTDIPYQERLDKILKLKQKEYCINDVNPYCAFWIYSQEEFKKFVASNYYDCNNIKGYGTLYGTTEVSAIGLHGLKTDWYKNTVIPIEDNVLNAQCKVFHLPNNYIKSRKFCNVRFNELLSIK